MRSWVFLSVAFLSACGGGRLPPDWELNSYAALNSYQAHYLKGDTRSADLEFVRLKNELSATGRPALIARAELVRCALRAASLEFDDCPAFHRADAGPEELAYMDYLSGKSARAPTDDALSKLVSYGVKFKSGQITPGDINAAVELSSEQGWRRPLLAWLGVQAKRAEAAGDREALDRIQRRISLVSGKAPGK
jgi:hypothetical protein